MHPRSAERPIAPAEDLVRSQLERILESDLFTRSERLSAFLRFVTERTLAGEGGTLKETVLGSELYGKGTEFDGAADPIVRVDARRLRDKLREYYSEFPKEPVVISLPKGTYVPVFEENGVPAPNPAHEVPITRRFPRWVWVASAMVLASVLAVLASRRLARPGPIAKAVRITRFPGQKTDPAFSPDGESLAFSSNGPEDRGFADIWITTLSGGPPRRLTETPQFTETAPAWSPDGREIAFVRRGRGVFIVPEDGGPERQVASSGSWVQWMPDGKSVLVNDGDEPYSISSISLETGERRSLTQPRIGVGDLRFSVSPEGSRLAFIRYEHPGVGDLYTIPLSGGGEYLGTVGPPYSINYGDLYRGFR